MLSRPYQHGQRLATLGTAVKTYAEVPPKSTMLSRPCQHGQRLATLGRVDEAGARLRE